MNAHLSLPVKNQDDGKILHITDTHLFANEDCLLLGVNTNASFDAVINAIKQQHNDFDLIVATGDFVQDGSQEAYLKFAQSIKQFSIPCVWLPGNHDNYANMTMVFTQQNLPSDNVILLGDKWLVILLNSQVEGQAYGMLLADELAFLSATLEHYPERYAIIFLHHHPIMSDCRWLDQHCLKNHVEFGNVIKQYHNIKAIGWGHIHQKMERMWHHCQVFSTPSTCVQFKPFCHDFTIANDSPCWRVIDLIDNGSVQTLLHCLEKNLFVPDISQNGY